MSVTDKKPREAAHGARKRPEQPKIERPETKCPVCKSTGILSYPYVSNTHATLGTGRILTAAALCWCEWGMYYAANWDRIGLRYVMYLDLPDELARKDAKNSADVYAFNRDLSVKLAKRVGDAYWENGVYHERAQKNQ